MKAYNMNRAFAVREIVRKELPIALSRVYFSVAIETKPEVVVVIRFDPPLTDDETKRCYAFLEDKIRPFYEDDNAILFSPVAEYVI